MLGYVFEFLNENFCARLMEAILIFIDDLMRLDQITT